MRLKRALIATSINKSSVSIMFRELAGELAQRGIEVHFLDDRRQTMDLDEYGVRAVHQWPGTSAPLVRGEVPSSARPKGYPAAKFAMSLVGELRPDLVIANFVAVSPLGIAARRWSVPRRVCWYHTLSSQVASDRRSRSAPAAARGQLLVQRKKLVYKCYTDVVTGSDAARQDFVTTFGRRMPPVTVRHLGILSGPTRVLPLRADAPVVAVGRLHRSKGHAALLRAIAMMAEPRRLTIYGEGPERETLEALALRLGVDVDLPGNASLEEIRESILPSAAALIMPSLSEAFGLAAVEALAAGIPVVASRVGGLCEVVTDGVTGYLVAPESPEELASAIDRVLEPRKNAELGRAAHSDFMERFEMRRRVSALADWLVD